MNKSYEVESMRLSCAEQFGQYVRLESSIEKADCNSRLEQPIE